MIDILEKQLNGLNGSNESNSKMEKWKISTSVHRLLFLDKMHKKKIVPVKCYITKIKKYQIHL